MSELNEYNEDKLPKTFAELVGEHIGRASMAWTETPTGIFDSDTCSVLALNIVNAHEAKLKKLRGERDKLVECLKMYASSNVLGIGTVARQTLKDIGEV